MTPADEGIAAARADAIRDEMISEQLRRAQLSLAEHTKDAADEIAQAMVWETKHRHGDRRCFKGRSPAVHAKQCRAHAAASQVQIQFYRDLIALLHGMRAA